MYSNEVKTIAARIGSFFLNKLNGDYEKTRVFIESMRINNISLTDDNKIVIELSRPGILIGVKGTQINDLLNYMAQPIHIVETMEHIEDYIVPYNWQDEDYSYEEN